MKAQKPFLPYKKPKAGCSVSHISHSLQDGTPAHDGSQGFRVGSLVLCRFRTDVLFNQPFNKLSNLDVIESTRTLPKCIKLQEQQNWNKMKATFMLFRSRRTGRDAASYPNLQNHRATSVRNINIRLWRPIYNDKGLESSSKDSLPLSRINSRACDNWCEWEMGQLIWMRDRIFIFVPVLPAGILVMSGDVLIVEKKTAKI